MIIFVTEWLDLLNTVFDKTPAISVTQMLSNKEVISAVCLRMDDVFCLEQACIFSTTGRHYYFFNLSRKPQMKK